MILGELSPTITLNSSDGGATVVSTTHVSGEVHEIYLKMPKPVGTNSNITIDTTDGARTILKIVNPSTVGTSYFPMRTAVGSTGNSLSSSDGTIAKPITLYKEKVRFTVASSSGLGGESVTAKLRWH